MLEDFHLHTLVSDGDLTPVALVREAASRGVTHLSITDHDSLGAYAWEGGAVLDEVRRLGLELTVGIEMDADMEGTEVHLLGFDFSREGQALRAHLVRVREARFERAGREIGIVNQLLGAGTIAEADIFAPGRETLMKPHFIHPILDRGHFATYEDANAWYRKNVKAGVPVPKPSIGDAIRLIHGAGGWTALAHPAYYERDGLPVAPRLAGLKALGLDGIELHYPYHACSPRQFTAEGERAFVDGLRGVAEPFGFRFTRGSDCHTAGDFKKVYDRL